MAVTVMKAILYFIFITLVVVFVRCQSDDESESEKIPTHQSDQKDINDGAYHEYEITPNITDANIKDTGNNQFAYLDNRATSNNSLLIFFGGTGSSPSQYHTFCRTASSLGYHVLNLDYLNTIPGTVCRSDENADCYGKYHREMWLGDDTSEKVSVNESNALTNRIVKFLYYLNSAHPEQRWSDYIQDGALNYASIILAGHSQGGGHATFIGYNVRVKRVISFAAPNDYDPEADHAASWLLQVPATPIENFYIMNHHRDEIVSPAEQYRIAEEMHLLDPVDTVHLSQSMQIYDSHVLISDFEPNKNATIGRLKHNSMIVDAIIPEAEAGQTILAAWKFLLGI
jgi:hypothetical protein